jgi:hypothetical protein
MSDVSETMQSMTEAELRAFEKFLLKLDREVDANPQVALDALPDAVHDLLGQGPIELGSKEEAQVLTNCAGVLINAAIRAESVAHLALSEGWLLDVLDSFLLENDPILISSMLYNLGNARTALADINERTERRSALSDGKPDWRTVRAVARWRQRDLLRSGRSDLTWAARLADGVSGDAVGQQLCNLGNTFDHSARWIEAYDAYAGALKADPTNGNAAGNAAVLVQGAIQAGWDFEGHMCSLYDHYLAMAKGLRERTVEVAGEHAAQRFDEMELLGSHAPLRVDPAPDDPYQQWVVEHRLALIAGLEGIGSPEVEGRWDSISLRQVIQPIDEDGAPTILSMLNVLKADYLVARRLGFEALEALDHTDGWAQHPSDPGLYVETLDYAVVGEASAKLVLAHRAALDVLDKVAVALNEHLDIGVAPEKVNFRKFWFEPARRPENQYDQLRGALLAHPCIASGLLAMAELAYDMAEDGIYAEAQQVRNAGTHRFVLLHNGVVEVPSTGTMKSLPVWEMQTTMLEALSVARAAYIYLVAILSVYEAEIAKDSGPTIPITMNFTP